MSRDSFVFYSSFAQAANTLGDKARLKLYDSVVKLGLCCAESETELNQLCTEIETSLAQNRNVLAQFLLIKPQIISNFKKFINGTKGKEYGVLGGAPKGNKNASKNNPKTTPNDNVNVNDNVNDNVIIKQKKKTLVSPDWKPKDTTVAKLTEKGLDADRVVDKFINSCIAKNLKYIDFDRAILTWDWSKDASLRVKNENIVEDWYL